MFKGYYVNLDRRPERRRRMEAELRRFKLANAYERVSAIDGQREWPNHPFPGAAGCLASHAKVLRIAAGVGKPLHILEDDVILSARLRPYLSTRHFANALVQYDLLFLDVWINPPFAPEFHAAFLKAGAGFELLDLRGMEIGSTNSYVVPPRSAAKVQALLDREIAGGAPLAVDLVYRRAVDSGVLRAAAVLPFLTCVDIETGAHSSIQDIGVGLSRQLIMLRTAFFAETGRQLGVDRATIPIAQHRAIE